MQTMDASFRRCYRVLPAFILLWSKTPQAENIKRAYAPSNAASEKPSWLLMETPCISSMNLVRLVRVDTPELRMPWFWEAG